MKTAHKKKKNIIFVFLTEFTRLKGLINWSFVAFIGFLLGLSSLNFLDNIIPFLFFIVSIFCIISFTFSINNYYDVDSDRENPRRKNINAMASGKISKRTGIILNTILVIIPLIISFLYRFDVFVFTCILIIWMWIYSAPPLRVKGIAGVDVIWHFFAFNLLVLWGSFISGSVELIAWLVAISMGIWSCIAQVQNHITDYDFDKKSGTITFAVWLGIDKSKITIKIISIFHMIFLIPLIILYSLSYNITFIILLIGICIGLVKFKSKKDYPVSSVYYFPNIFGIIIYLNCILYHIITIY